MTRDECARLVNKLIATWPTGVRGVIWTDVLTNLEYDLAKTAYLELRDNHDRPPTVAHFQAAYRTARTTRDRNRDDEPEPQIPTSEQPITPAEYWRRLAARAKAGNTDAADELDRWRRYDGVDEVLTNCGYLP